MVFVIAIWKPGKRAIIGAIDSRAERIRQELDAARSLREEAQQALSTYASYFGPYEVSDTESYEVTRQVGSINPAQVGQLALRRLTFVGDNRVILKPPPAILDEQLAQGYITWERVTPPIRSTLFLVDCRKRRSDGMTCAASLARAKAPRPT